MVIWAARRGGDCSKKQNVYGFGNGNLGFP